MNQDREPIDPKAEPPFSPKPAGLFSLSGFTNLAEKVRRIKVQREHLTEAQSEKYFKLTGKISQNMVTLLIGSFFGVALKNLFFMHAPVLKNKS